MLKTLKVQNLAIIEDVDIEFTNELTCLTGETGAGKSLIIDSLNLIFGKRADNDLIRFEEEEAYLKAHFINYNTEVEKYLRAKDLYDNDLIIERILSSKGNNKVLINNKLVPLQTLRELSFKIGDIHEQHDTVSLINPETSLDLLDKLANLKDNLNDFVISKYEYEQIKKKYEDALNKTLLQQEKLKELKYIKDELNKAHLKEDEIETLKEQINTLSNQKEIIINLEVAYDNLSKIDDENLLYDSFKALNLVKEFNLLDLKERIETAYYELSDLKNELFNKLDEVRDISILELESLEERYFFLKELESKYQKTLRELIIYEDELEEEIFKTENFDQYILQAKNNMEKAYLKAYEKAVVISNKRKETALLVQDEFVKLLNSLDISYVDFKVDFKEIPLLNSGIDEVVFLISLNKGEPLKPFYKVASGGELSRSMFAFKILYGRINKLDLMVFDEIDMGVSGNAALKVAEALKKLAASMQVIAITHLPQVASKANYHYHISKELIKNRTQTKLELLVGEKRIYQLAYMLSGSNLTEGAILHAKELLK